VHTAILPNRFVVFSIGCLWVLLKASSRREFVVFTNRSFFVVADL
jgi:hypothetical protein